MIEKLQPIKCYYKSELADFYEVNRKVFMSWVNKIEYDLRETGYKKTQKIFTLKQVEMIFNHIGHPEATGKDYFIDELVAVRPYKKHKLCDMYDISETVLFKQIKSIPIQQDVRAILKNEKTKFYQPKNSKNFFSKNEVELIFKHLGRPYAKAV